MVLYMRVTMVGSWQVVRRGDSCLQTGCSWLHHSMSLERALHSISFPMKDGVWMCVCSVEGQNMEDWFQEIQTFAS